MPTKDYNITYTLSPGSYGVLVEYREQSSAIWIKPTAPQNPTMAQSYPLTLDTGKSYFIRLTTQGVRCSPQMVLLSVIVPAAGTCCPAGYTLSPDGNYCYQIDESGTVHTSQSNVCLAPSVLYDNYSVYGTRFYDPGFDVHLAAGGYTLANSIIAEGYWKQMVNNTTTNIGPMNREGVWLDSDCDGTKDALTAGAILQFSYVINSTVDKTVYVGMGGDNGFRLDVNNANGNNQLIVEVSSGQAADGVPINNFRWWHVMPVNITSGPNLFNFKATGDGTTNDAFAAVIYDNTLAQLVAATADTDLNILFQTSDYIGGHVDIAYCDAGYQLDTSGGVGAYKCVRTLTAAPYTC